MFIEPWTELTKSLLQQSRAVNRAVFAPYRTAPTEAKPEEPAASRSDADAADQPAWAVDRTIATPGTVTVGDTVTVSTVLAERDLEPGPSAISEPSHRPDDGIAATRSGGQSDHATLLAGLTNAALAQLPGRPTTRSLDLTVLAPVYCGERVHVRIVIDEQLSAEQYRVSAEIERAAGETLGVGEVIVLLADRPPS